MLLIRNKNGTIMNTKRVTVYLDGDTFEQLEALAKVKQAPISRVSSELIRNRLEDEDDLYLSKLADERAKETKYWLSHDEIWKNKE